MTRRPPRSTRVRSSAASDVYKRQRRPRRQFAGDGSELCLRLQPVGRRVVELRAVDIERAGNMAISRRGRRLLLTEEKRSRARVDQSGAAALLDLLDVGSERQD